MHQRLHATEVHATPVFSFPLSLSLVLVQQRTLCLRRSGTATSTLLMVRSLSTTSRCSTTTRLYVPFVSMCVCMRVCACVYVSSPLSLSLSRFPVSLCALLMMLVSLCPLSSLPLVGCAGDSPVDHQLCGRCLQQPRPYPQQVCVLR